MLVKLDHETPNRGENKKYLKPPPRILDIMVTRDGDDLHGGSSQDGRIRG